MEIRQAVKAIVRHVPAINRIVKPRDDLPGDVAHQEPSTKAREFVVAADWDWFQKSDLRDRFLKRMSEAPSLKIMEIGSRRVPGRDSTSHKHFAHPTSEYIGCDFMAGDDVDVVADAHTLSQTFPQDHFDMVLTVATYEHLSRPWIATKEIASVLKPGGCLFIQTHQTFPLHGYPNDYFRFSAEALSLLCEDAGLQVLETAYDYPVSLVSLLDPRGSLAPAYILVSIIAEKPRK